MTEADKSLKGSFKKSVGWTFLARGGIVLVTVGGGAVLARLLTPEQFGIVAAAKLFTGIATRFGNLGFGMSLIQRKEITPDHVSTLFTSMVATHGSICLLLMGIGYFLGGVIDKNPMVGNVLCVMALDFALMPFSTVSTCLLQRKMGFKCISVASFLDHVSSAVLAIILAFAGLGVWSLAIGSVGASLVGTIVMMVGAGFWPRIKFVPQAMKELSRYGIWMMLGNLMNYAKENVDYLIVWRQLGHAQLGLYEKAFRLMDVTVKEFTKKIGGVLFAAFTKIHEDRGRFRAAYRKVNLVQSLIVYPLTLGMLVTAPPLVVVVYGPKWEPSIAPLQILCLAAIFRMNSSSINAALYSSGAVKGAALQRIANLILMTAGCIFGARWGIEGVAAAVLATNVLLAIGLAFVAMQKDLLRLSDLTVSQLPALFGSGVMVAALIPYSWWGGEAFGPHSAVLLLTEVCIGAILYPVAVLVLRNRMVSEMVREFGGDALRAVKRLSPRKVKT